jgi:hypothetical protein
MPYPISASQHRDLINLINGTYLDRVEQITAAEVDDQDNIIAVALDGQKKLAVKVTDNDIAIRLMGGEPAANFLKFAAPAKKPKKCSKGISCGASCIAASKTCRKKTTPTQKAQKTKIVKEAKAAPKAVKLEPKVEVSVKVAPKADLVAEQLAIENEKKKVAAKKQDKVTDLSDSPAMLVEKEVQQHQEENKQKQKAAAKSSKNSLPTTPESEDELVPAKKAIKPPVSAKKLTAQQNELISKSAFGSDVAKGERIVKDNPSITKEEGEAFASYIGSDYENINRTFWDKDFSEDGDKKEVALAKARAAGAVNALQKMPAVTKETLLKTIKDSEQASPLAKDDLLTHHRDVDDSEEFLSQYQKALADGSSVAAGQLLSTSWQEGGHPGFARGANIEFKIKPKLDGSGAGRLVDKYKNYTFEDEILYPPATKFKITGIKTTPAIPEKFEITDEIIHTDKHQDLSKIVSKLEWHLNKGISLETAKKATLSEAGWNAVNGKHKLDKYPSNPADAEGYIAKLKLQIEKEAKKGKLSQTKSIIEESVPERHTIYKEEL